MSAANAASHLASDRVNLLELKDWLRREFLSFFEDANGKKVNLALIFLMTRSGSLAH